MADDLSKDVGAFIRLKREGLSLSQVDCSDIANIARSTLRDLEQGKRLPNGREMISLSSVLKTTPSAILSASDSVSNFDDSYHEAQNGTAMLTSYVQMIFGFNQLNRSSKELVKSIVFQLACGDIKSSERGRFIETYTRKIPDDISGIFTHAFEGKEGVMLNVLEDTLRDYNNGEKFMPSFMKHMTSEKYHRDLSEAMAEFKSKKETA